MPNTWPIAQRVIHLSGGLRVINKPRDKNIYLYPTIPGQKLIVETIESYASIYNISKKYGLIIGVDFYEQHEQIHGIYPPDWRVYTRDKGAWLGFSTIQKSAEIMNNAYQQGNLEFVDCIDKVQAWANATSRALRGISESYHQVLSSRCKAKEFNAPQAFDDMNCDYINDSMHNFLYYAGTLRDHIAEFIIFHIMRQPSRKLKENPVMSRLKKDLEASDNDHGLGEIKKEIIKGYNVAEYSSLLPGWLYQLSRYRNIITHEKPINTIAGKSWPWQLIHEAGECFFPILKFPIPHLPLSNADYFKDVPEHLREKLKRVAPSQDFMLHNPDGLEMAWRLLLQILIFLDNVLDKSPIKPKPIRFDNTNSWDFRRVE